MTRTAALLLILFSPLVAAPVPKPLKKQDDRKAILGYWRGDVLNPGQGGNPNFYRFHFGDDGTCGIGSGSTPSAPDSSSEYALDPTHTPKRMKWLNGPQKTEWLCVYELDGDVLRVGFVHAKSEVPPDVTPRAGVTVYELKRVIETK